ncbi:protein MULTIPOLAR SPINDLE 1 [Punica granatum]|uniref:Protein MULTIPOLAR SPINDLE 1 n=1 Tax=Punica granatum TaxID=22663 RepID=A0A6P8CV76_PUNGR|nr:protein MULTIPOLAR SPINDLE 1 [Punica granatum]
MASSETLQRTEKSSDDQSLKLALAISLLRSKLQHKQPPPPPPSLPPPPPPPEADALRWKRKAKERKQEILRLREDLKVAEDASRAHQVPEVASCKCYFYNELGKMSSKELVDGSDCSFSDVLRRRFLKQVRYKQRRRKRDGSISDQRRSTTDLNKEDETEQLISAVDFLVDLCDTVFSVEEANFANWCHQAADFLLASLKNLLSLAENMETIQGTVNGLTMRLIRRMIYPARGNEPDDIDSDVQFYVQHLIRKLACEPYIGQRILVAVSQNIYSMAESLLFCNPFDDNFVQMHGAMFILIQLLEFLVSDYLSTWSRTEAFDKILFEEWLISVVHARKAVELLESRNTLYILYMDRLIGQLAKQLDQISSLHQLNPDTLRNLFH